MYSVKKLFASAMLSAALVSAAAAQAPAAAPTVTPPAATAQAGAIPAAPLPATAAAPRQSMEWIGFAGGALLVIIGGIIIYRRTRDGNKPAGGAPAGLSQQGAPGAAARTPAPAPQPAPAPAAPQWNGPPGFTSAAFLADAKASFIRMQAAWDKADTADLKEFTTPQVFTELAAQIDGRGQTADVTEVVTIDAELLGIETIGEDYLASVKFTGMIKAAPSAAAEPFAEVWNMARPLKGGNAWMLAGIQQLS